MINRIEIKKEAKEIISNKLGEAIKILLLFFLISFLAGFVIGFGMGIFEIDSDSNLGTTIKSVLEIILNGLFSFGMLSFYLKLSRSEDVTYKELFSKTNMFFKFIITSLLMGLIIAGGCLLFIIPGIILAIALSLTMYVLLDNPNMSSIDAIKRSYDMMKGYKMEFFMLQLSFLGWLILGIFTLGILYLWLIPYMSVAQANFYNKIKDIYDQKNLG